MTSKIQHTVGDEKYTVTFNEKTGELSATRGGQPWRDLSGDKLVYCMLVEIDTLKKDLAAMQRLSSVSRDRFAQLEHDNQLVDFLEEHFTINGGYQHVELSMTHEAGEDFAVGFDTMRDLLTALKEFTEGQPGDSNAS